MLDQTADSLAILDELSPYTYRFCENASPWSAPLSGPMDRDMVLQSLERLGPGVSGDVYAKRS